MKRIFLFLSMLALVVLACDLSAVSSTAVPADEATPTPEIFISLTQAIPETALPPTSAETSITYSPLSMVVPQAIADGASGSDFPRVDAEDAAYWQKTPGHLKVMLGDYYVLQGKSLQPEIYVFPAQAYAELVPSAFESMHRLNNILYDPNAPISAEGLPAVPFFNAQQVFASKPDVISFQNGSGVRFLTEYAQYPASANNQDLFYQFQGLTSDGAYYIVAILPITVPVLAETSDPAAVLPPGGVPYPDMADPSADFEGYYSAVEALLNGTSPDAFTPAIGQLDAMILSMKITP